MTHWFDTFSKKAAKLDGIERRSFLAFGTVLGIGALGGRAEAEDLARPATRAPNGTLPATIRAAGQPLVVENALGSHVRRTAGPLVIHETSTEKGGVSLKSTVAINRTTQNVTISAAISRGSDLLAKLDIALTKGGVGTVNIYYGAAFSAVKSVSMSTKNGKTFQGTADGRAFTVAGTQVEFLDHAPPPQIFRDPNLAAAVRGLDVQSKALIRSGVQATPAPPRPTAGIGLRAEAKPVVLSQNSNECGPHRPEPTGPGWEWYEPGDDEVDCSVCESDCGSNTASWILDIFTFGASEPEYYAGCMIACNVPGGGCLPTPCGFLTTCGPNDTCFSAGGGRLCCPSPAAICKDVCCGTEITKCGSDGQCGCATGTKVCEQDCCEPGHDCCNGTCCPKGDVCTDGVCCKPGVTTCKGVCCAKGQVCHNGSCCSTNNICGPTCCDELSSCLNPKTGVCCGFDQQMCGNTCCPIGFPCVNGKCCDPNSVCGGVCCPAGQTCTNAATHKCAPCPPKQVPCLSTNGVGICCPAGVECCGTTCCNPGEQCYGSGKSFVCGPAEVIK